MKKLLLLLAFLPLLTMAQGVEYSISGGLCSNTGPVNTVLPANTTETGLLPSYAGSLGLLINLGPWQVGIVAEAYELKTTRDVVTSFPAGDLHAKSTVQYASPQIPILLQINRVFYMPRSNIYLGIAGWSAVNMLKNAAGEMKYHELQPVFGAQLGYTYGISNLIGINVNLAARYNAVPGSPIISFPLTAGIRIRP